MDSRGGEFRFHADVLSGRRRVARRFTMEKTDITYIIDDQAAGEFRVSHRAYTDPQCLEEERARLFGRCWIYVGHESEVPHAGDYRARSVAGRPMVLVRGDDNVIRVLLNTC